MNNLLMDNLLLLNLLSESNKKIKKLKKKKCEQVYYNNINYNDTKEIEKITEIKILEKLHPYLNQIKLDDTLLKNIDDIINFVINKNDIRPKININNISDYNKYIVLSEKISDIDYNHDADYMGNTKEKKFALITKKLMDKVTDFVNDNFFIDPNKYYEFIRQIINLFENAINKYIDEKSKLGENLTNKIRFIFKGGNLLRAMFLRYTSIIPDTIRNKLLKNYGENFKNSDLDFQIFIDPSLDKKTYVSIYNDMINLSYLCLNRFRNYYTQNLASMFDFYNYKDEKKRDLLIKLKNNLNKSDLFTDTEIENNIYLGAKIVNLQFYDIHTDPDIHKLYMDNKTNVNFFSDSDSDSKYKEFINIVNGHIINNNFQRRDFYLTNKKIKQDNEIRERFIASKLKNIDFEIDNDFVKKLHPDNKNKSEFYSTVNDSIHFKQIEFSLIRTKFNLIAYIQFSDGKYGAKHIPGELIDISIATYNDIKIRDMDKIFIKNFEKYIYENQNSNYNIPSFEYYSYTLYNFIKDLLKILFVDADYPWVDLKYEKRIHRVCILYITELFSLENNKFILNGTNKLNDIINLLINISDETKSIIGDKFNYDDINELLDLFDKLNLNSYGIYKFYKYLRELLLKIDKVADSTEKNNLIKKYKEFIKFIYDHNILVKDMIKDMDDYIKSPEVLHYNIDTFKNIPNIKQKYLKYKQKYLELKNKF